CPADSQLQCGESTSVASNGTATATDNCGGNPTITHSDSATVNCTGQAGVDRLWTATDSCNNAASCTQHISYVDTTAPVISCPADTQLQCGQSTSIASNGTATAIDNCGGSPTITSSDTATTNCTGQ